MQLYTQETPKCDTPTPWDREDATTMWELAVLQCRCPASFLCYSLLVNITQLISQPQMDCQHWQSGCHSPSLYQSATICSQYRDRDRKSHVNKPKLCQSVMSNPTVRKSGHTSLSIVTTAAGLRHLPCKLAHESPGCRNRPVWHLLIMTQSPRASITSGGVRAQEGTCRRWYRHRGKHPGKVICRVFSRILTLSTKDDDEWEKQGSNVGMDKVVQFGVQVKNKKRVQLQWIYMGVCVNSKKKQAFGAIFTMQSGHIPCSTFFFSTRCPQSTGVNDIQHH